MISVQNLGVEFSARPLFTGVSFVVNRQDRIGLAGKNGAGKSTLLKIISGLQQPTHGTVAIPDGITIGYLPQQMNLADSTTVADETRKAFADIGYDGWAAGEMIPPYTHASDQIIYNTSKSMDRILKGEWA